MTNDQPTQPLTGFELDNIEGRWQRYVALRDADSMETSVHDVPDLLAEVDRIRAELALTARARDYLATRMENQIKAHERTTQKLENAYAERALLFSALDQSGEGQAKEAAPCARLHDTESKSAHVALNTVPMCFLADGHEAPHRCLCGKEWNNE